MTHTILILMLALSCICLGVGQIKIYRYLLKRIKALEPTEAECYVIIYDMPTGPFGDDEMAEEYYGYFSSPEEARAVWAEFTDLSAGGLSKVSSGVPQNVKLCRVVQSWEK